MEKPLVAIVGRPNVGKSTLFNRLVGERVAIVEDIPGTTRDRLYGETEWSGRDFTVVDTGGLDLTPGGDVTEMVRSQAELAMDEADVILFVVDARDGLLTSDEEIADVLRRTNKPVIVVANKAETEERRMSAATFYQLGVGDVVAISSIHGHGVGDLLDLVVDLLPPSPPVEHVEKVTSAAIVGRPNVGKSSLLNALLGQERVIVNAVPGTARDAIDTLVEHDGAPVMLIDTAGIRRRGRVQAGVEKYSVLRALRAIDRADVALIVIDAGEGPTEQDAHIAGYVEKAGKGLAIVVNKWDLIGKKGPAMVSYARRIREDFKFVAYAPILFVSAKTRYGVDQIMDTVLRIAEQRERRINTSILNDAIGQAVDEKPLSSRGKQLRVYYVTQVASSPPMFVLFVNDPRMVHFSYERYLENRLRDNFGFEGTPIKLVFRRRGE